MANKNSGKKAELRPRFRVICGKNVALGPGKVELLAALVETQSLNEAAKRLGMSYTRAWRLVGMMNKSFREPVAIAERGGKSGGGMQVTETGRAALRLYQEIEYAALRSAGRSWLRLEKMLRV